MEPDVRLDWAHFARQAMPKNKRSVPSLSAFFATVVGSDQASRRFQSARREQAARQAHPS